MKISYNEACTLHNSNLELDIQLANSVGFDLMELRIDKLKEYLKTHTVEDLKIIFNTRHLAPNTINGTYLYAGFLHDDDDPVRRDALLKDIRFACEIGKTLGVTSMVVVPPMNSEAENLPYGDTWENIVDMMVLTLGRLADFVAPYGMRLAVEMVGSHRCSIRTIDQARQIVEKTGRDNIGYAIDAFNLFLYQKSNDYGDLRALNPKDIYIVHINNGEEHSLVDLRQAHRTYCNEGGAIDLKKFLESLKTIGYDESISIEFFRQDQWNQSPEAVVKQAYQTTRECLIQNGISVY